MKEMKIRCKKCKKALILKHGTLDKERHIDCQHCGEKNSISKKKNGKLAVA